MMRIWGCLLLGWIFALSLPTKAEVGEDRSVVAAALSDFATTLLTDDDKKIILIAKNTIEARPVTRMSGCEPSSSPPWESLFDKHSKGSDCSFSEALEKAFAEKNSKSSDASLLYKSTKRWRMASLEQEKLGEMGLFYARTEDGKAIETKVWLSRPAYNERGDRAYVTFDFTSAHGASVSYLLSKKDGVWQVTCSRWMYYV